MPLPLPPGLSQAEFNTVTQKFADIVGRRWVFTDESDVNLYRDAYSPLWGEPDERIPSAAVAPETVEQVQAIVQVANAHKAPLFPVSTGKNLGYGGSAPNLTGSVVVDLKRMNKILEVDDKRHFAIVEPGVAYFDLYNHIQENNLKVWIDTPDPGWGSLIGNSLDHGVGYTYGAYRDHFHSHSGMEVVLPNGEIMRTGMGALPGAKTWGEYRYGYGPYVDGLFSQGNFGIVTKMGFHLMPAPDAYLSAEVYVPRRQDLIPLVEIVNALEHAGVVGMPNYSSPMNALTRDPDIRAKIASREGFTDAELNQLAEQHKLASWSVELQFYGAPGAIDANWAAAQAKLSAAIPGARFEERHRYSFPQTQEQKDAVQHKVAVGIPNMAIFLIGARSEMNPEPTDGHLWFSSVIPKSGEAIMEAQQVYKEASLANGLPPVFSPFSTPQTWMYRTFIFISGFPISRKDQTVNQRSRKLFETYVRAASAAGFGEYRAPPAFQQLVSDAYSFNNHALRRFTETMKDAVDPNGIFAPGRGGIWPKRFREKV